MYFFLPWSNYADNMLWIWPTSLYTTLFTYVWTVITVTTVNMTETWPAKNTVNNTCINSKRNMSVINSDDKQLLITAKRYWNAGMCAADKLFINICMPTSGQTSRQRNNVLSLSIHSSMRPLVCYQTCEHMVGKCINSFWCKFIQVVTRQGWRHIAKSEYVHRVHFWDINIWNYRHITFEIQAHFNYP